MNLNFLDISKINFERNRSVFVQLLKRELANSYKGAVLGVLWMLLRPVVMALILFLIFQVLLGLGGPLFLIYILVGVLVWNFLSSSLLGMTTSLKRNASIVKNVPNVQVLFPIVSVSSSTIEFAVGLFVLIPAFIYFQAVPSSNLLYFPFIVLTQIAGVTGLGLLLSVAYPVIPDVKQIVELTLRLLYFASPVFYSPDIIENEMLKDLYMYNPVATLMSLYRWSLMGGDIYSLPAVHHIVFCVMVCVGFLVLGIFGFKGVINSAVKSL